VAVSYWNLGARTIIKVMSKRMIDTEIYNAEERVYMTQPRSDDRGWAKHSKDKNEVDGEVDVCKGTNLCLYWGTFLVAIPSGQDPSLFLREGGGARGRERERESSAGAA
jgi:hypothetical protein